MGTNYYYKPNPCPTCGHGKEIHIGKSSGGWTFSFHGTYTIKAYSDWVSLFRSGGVIVDEYGSNKTIDEFCNLVASKSREKQNHAKVYPNDRCWLDEAGNGFCAGEFC